MQTCYIHDHQYRRKMGCPEFGQPSGLSYKLFNGCHPPNFNTGIIDWIYENQCSDLISMVNGLIRQFTIPKEIAANYIEAFAARTNIKWDGFWAIETGSLYLVGGSFRILFPIVEDLAKYEGRLLKNDGSKFIVNSGITTITALKTVEFNEPCIMFQWNKRTGKLLPLHNMPHYERS